MSANSTETAGEAETDPQSEANHPIPAIEKRGRDGSAAILAGSAMLAWALKTVRKSTARATLLALAAFALLRTGRRQRRAGRTEDGIETGSDVRRDEEGEKKVSDEAHVEAERDLGAQRNADESQSVDESETDPNPRGMSDGTDVQTDDGGEIDFVEGKEGGEHRETHLEDEDAHDPRLHPENDDERTEIDLSEAAMADEASEATGPHPEQAYPAREGTDPEPTSEKAPERIGEGAVAPGDTDTEEDQAGDETEDGDETEGDESTEATD